VLLHEIDAPPWRAERRGGAFGNCTYQTESVEGCASVAPPRLRLRALNVGMSRQIEHERDAARAAARAFQAIGEHRDRERRAARPDERLEVEIVARVALPDALHAFATAEGASGSDTPSERKGLAESFHHGNTRGTDCGGINNPVSPY
jgi:hypothetical protein